ncbi:novel plant SNARE 13 [Selaginella moellendorffii]|uniref:novel plant SNARE 13 n=1 Tax=Selaginella moellendorffii TaxID=88036 RepID=UPI000D1C6266|nr:novel plant SNARE 13 [Selaginella moellendorffii]|eukprot:XP_024521436.1 novel plant SNARE 13 [Selaginella moellendorffii]
MDKIKEPGRQSKDLEGLRECKRLMKEFREIKEEESMNPPDLTKQLNEKEQSLVSSRPGDFASARMVSLAGGPAQNVSSCVCIPSPCRCLTSSSLFPWFRPAMSNQQLMDAGKKTMDETDQKIERVKKGPIDAQMTSWHSFLPGYTGGGSCFAACYQ